MSQSPVTVTDSLEDILSRLDGKIDRLENKIDTLQKDVTEIKLEVTTLKAPVENIDKRLEKVEGTQKNQVWTLITLLGGSLIAVGFRGFLSGTNP